MLYVSTGRANISISTNGGYFPPIWQGALQFTGVIAADAGSGFLLTLQSDGHVTNWVQDFSEMNVPAGLSNVTAISAGSGSALALTRAGTVVAWGLPAQTNVPNGLSNVVAINAGFESDLALRGDGTVISWGAGSATNVPGGLSNVVAIAGGSGDLALKADGTVVAWGYSFLPPAGLSNVIAISTGVIMLGEIEGALALQADGKVIGWDSEGAFTNLLASNITNTVEISGSPDAFLALQADGSVVIGGKQPLISFPQTLANVFSLGKIDFENTVVVEGYGSPVFTIQPGSQTVGAGETIYLHARAVGAQPISYQWQFNGTNLPGATDGDLILTNATVANAGLYQAVIMNDVINVESATSDPATVAVHSPPVQVPTRLSAPIVQPDGSIIITASGANGAAFPLTNPSLFLFQTSTDLIHWKTLTNGFSLTNGAIEFAGQNGATNSAGFYRLVGQ
jgi:hypothetical protein